MSVLLFLLAWLRPSPGQAQVRQALALPVQMIGYFPERQVWQKTMNERSTESLTKLGYSVLAPRGGTNNKCHDAACLDVIRRTQHVDLVLATEIRSDDSQTPDFAIRVWVLDAQQQGPARAVEDKCTDCNETRLAEKLFTLCTDLISNKEPTPAIVATPTPPPSHGRRNAFIAMGTIAAALAVGSAVGFGFYLSYHHRPNCDASFPLNRPCPIEYDATTGAALTGTAMVSFAILSAVGFGLAAKANKQKVALLPTLWPSGGALVAAGAF